MKDLDNIVKRFNLMGIFRTLSPQPLLESIHFKKLHGIF